MKALLAACAALALALSHPNPIAAQSKPQDKAPPDPCKEFRDASSDWEQNFFTFDQFDRELRTAIRNQDPVALAFLVKFPLRVNDSGDTISLDNPAALKTHFQDVFTPAVRKAILDQPASDLGCMIEGVGYGLGVIWVSASERGYAIWSVNRDATPPYPKSKNEPKVKYLCQTQTHRIVVDLVASGALRYRAWNKPRQIAETPDLEMTNGADTWEGTNVCAVPIYTFKNGTAVYRVEGGLGCFGDNEPGPPKEATGRLEVTTTGKRPMDSWCY